MSGDKQHHIPRSMQRGFLTEHTGKTEKVVVYRRGGKMHVSPIADVGAKRHFYSTPSADGTKTLDDYITDYEGRLAELLVRLRGTGIGDVADAAVAAEVITHLATRNASLRNSFGAGFQRFLGGAAEAFSAPDAFSRMMGLNQRTPNDTFRETLWKTIAEDERFQIFDAAGIPTPVVERFLFTIIKESGGKLLAAQSQRFTSLIASFATQIDGLMDKGHNDALSKSLVPEVRRQSLEQLEWRIFPAPTGGAILPDCVALGINSKDVAQPFMMIASSDTTSVMMPLTKNSILVGTRIGGTPPNLAAFNENAAQCSHDFFITASKETALGDLAHYIGARTTSEIERVVSNALQQVLPLSNAEAMQPADAAEDRLPAQGFSYDLTFIDCPNDEQTSLITNEVRKIINSLQTYLSLARLDGITFASDYPAALRNLDRGFKATRPLETVPADIGYGVCQSALVVRAGVKKVRVVMRGEYAHALLSDDPELAGVALHFLISELTTADTIEHFDRSLPEYLLSSVSSGDHDGVLYQAMYPAVLSYFSARGSAGYTADEVMENMYRDLAVEAMERADIAIDSAKRVYETDLQIDPLYNTALRSAADVLSALARLFGHCHTLGISAFPKNDPVEAALTKRNLRKWVDEFGTDLNRIWQTRSAWTSLQEHHALNVNTERLLWQMGLMPWALPQGGTYVRVLGPMAIFPPAM